MAPTKTKTTAAKKKQTAAWSKSKTTAAKKKKSTSGTGKPAPRAAKRTSGAGSTLAVSAWDRSEIPEQQQFYLCSGQRLRNISELAEILDEMQKEVFEYHVSDERNDIHAWVRDVFHEDALADDLLGAADAHQMREIIQRYAPEGA